MNSTLSVVSIGEDVFFDVSSPCDSISNASFSTVGPVGEALYYPTKAALLSTPRTHLLEPVDRALETRQEVLCRGPSRANFAVDRQKIRAHRQLMLNQFILRETKACAVSREDHHIMLRQLIATAYANDPRRREHRQQWRQLVASVRKEYWGASAILSLSPDPYHTVLAKLSSMMLWDNDCRRWDYTYCDDAVADRHARQKNILSSLASSGKLFL